MRGWHLRTGSGPLDIIFGYILEAFTQDEALITRIQTYKGLLFVLTSDRFYRAALPADEALEIIKSQAGRHFDPDVIDVFLQLNIPELSPSTADLGLAV